MTFSFLTNYSVMNYQHGPQEEINVVVAHLVKDFSFNDKMWLRKSVFKVDLLPFNMVSWVMTPTLSSV